MAAGDGGALAAQAGPLRAARDSLQAAIDNTDILLDMVGRSVGESPRTRCRTRLAH